MNPKTGKVYALASQPTYDPNLVENHFNLIKAPGAPCHPAAPLLNRATDGLFTPGSTFKVVTATAALDSHKFTPESTFYDPGYCIEYGKQVSNAASPDGPVESFGHPTLALGLQHSINSVFCNVGKALGAGTILEYMKKFGFYKDPPLETPANEKVPSGLYNGGRLFFPSHPATGRAFAPVVNPGYARRTSLARGPLGLASTSKVTFSPPCSRSKSPSIPLRWKKNSLPSSAAINPKPRSATSFLMVPVGISISYFSN